MSIDIILQARVGSKRLPKKVLMKLGGKSVLNQIISRIKKISNIKKAKLINFLFLIFAFQYPAA